MGIILLPEDIAGQLAQDKIKREVAQVSSRKNQLTLHTGITKEMALSP
jgi:hypothetical protein